MAEIIGRFAPTPSGRLHLGNIACAMLCWLSARRQGGRALLRIEDVDKPRCPRALADRCLKDLDRLGFDWDGATVFQSERDDVYRGALDRLTRSGLTYPCFCTRAKLRSEAAPNLGDTQYVYSGACRRLSAEEISRLSAIRAPAVRLRVPDEEIAFTDGLYGPVRENLARECGDFVLRRSDGLFGYQLASVVDDALSGVTEVVRGADILTATPRQIFLQRCLGFATPVYRHIPLLTDAAGRRLAKRDGDADMDTLLMRHSAGEILGALAFAYGILPEYVPASLPELLSLFSWEKVRKKTGAAVRLPEGFREARMI